MSSGKKLSEFWDWFASNAKRIGESHDAELLGELDERVRSINSRLSWEIGPGRHERWSLAISPNLDCELVNVARAIVAAAPPVPGWELFSMRQPKQWNYQVEISEDGSSPAVRLDASSWQFVLLRYPNGLREVLLTGDDLPELTDDQRWQAAAIVLEGALGEESMMEKIDDFELVSQLEPRFAKRARPISGLKSSLE